MNQYQKEWFHKNCERLSQKAKLYYKKNKVRILATQKEYVKNNPDTRRETSKRYYENNKSLYIAKDAKRQADKYNATPPWFEDQSVKLTYAIAAAYKRQGRNVHVDHIIPLRGKLVSGLHCAENLQILSAAENRSKCNKFAV